MADRFLIINADDFGYNDVITQGILKGYRDGLVTSTTAMINIDGAAARLAAARSAEPRQPVGLHLTLTAGKPILPAAVVPHLVQPDGTFTPFEELLLRLPDIPVGEVRAELFAQAEALCAAAITFDHIDYHQQVLALFTPFYRVVGELAQTYSVPVRQPALTRLRHKAAPGKPQQEVGMIVGFLSRALRRSPARAARMMLQIMRGAERKQIAARAGTTDWFIGAFFDDPTLENFCSILQQLPAGTSELMTHPAIELPELATICEGYREQRPLELAVLLDVRARAAMERLGIHLVSFASAQAQ